MKSIAVNAAVVVAVLLSGFWVHGQVASESHQRCIEAQSNRDALRGIILRGRDVGKPGTPGFAYYHAHPEEAAKALQRVNQALVDLPVITCD